MASTPISCDSGELVALMRSGDMEALDRITRCFGDRLIGVGRRYCRSEEEAQDAVQDAMVSAGEHLRDFRGDGPVEGWMVRMVANACHRMRRGRKNDPALHDTEVVLPDFRRSPEDALEFGQMSEILGQVLDELPARDRVIVLLAEAEDWTGPEIADKLGMTSGAVRTRLSRARTRVRAAMQERVETGETLGASGGS
ncbi:MAG: sigma-70 family RNA polymerase sigma factor [Deltaproteobacteria bacterium]|nr:sigma-70 family RNA polymerase sigma factor [Deltaproteobacteria bacterium]MBW2253647.1 sigma-70 family RNA polymerase sigma factor [Deltaproteobacteria bacterium]